MPRLVQIETCFFWDNSLYLFNLWCDLSYSSFAMELHVFPKYYLLNNVEFVDLKFPGICINLRKGEVSTYILIAPPHNWLI